jgi:translation initiation factor IF-2
MKKIRINELARELEVKPQRVLDLLPQFGVTEKKTHSSSVDEDVAEKIRRRLTGEGRAEPHEPEAEHPIERADEPEPKPAMAPSLPVAAEEAATPPVPAVTAVPEPVALAPLGPPVPPPAPPAPEVHSDKVPAPEPPTPAVASSPEIPAPAKPVAAPLRPPLLTGGQRPPVPPAMPVQPRTTVPARPTPPPAAPRPGQILSGPRQPLPGGAPPPQPAPAAKAEPAARPGTPVAATPGVPRSLQTLVKPGPAGPGRLVARGTPSPAAPAAAPNQPQPQRPPARTGLVGQPAQRPTVQPNPELAARLRGSTPAMPRPGQPAARPGSPVPGRPIYEGPVRPGQPLVRQGPGMPSIPSARGRQRPLHPTTPGRIEPAVPLPSEQQRRHQGKPAARGGVRHRDQEAEERSLRMPTRRDQPVEPPPIDREITIAEGVTVKELSEKLGVKANLVIKKLVEKKIFATINQTLDVKLAEELAREFGASTNKLSYEEETTQGIELAEESADLVKRPPVVTIMGHVDHGKTSLLDAIRLTNVAEREAGGITQHIGAYHVEKNGQKIVFIDTPGHEAFTRMRARGAKVTDIVVLVVAADDGVMPQTLEAIDHARAAKVPIIVAINKIDKPEAQPERIKQQLADRGLLAEDWGGDTVMVPVSAKAKQNLDLLLEMILLVADMNDLKGNPDRPATGAVLEAKLDRGRGPVATVLVRNGTLKVGDYFICGSVFSKVRALFDDRGNPVREAGPSMPVEVLGLDSLPEVGDSFQVVTDTAKAKQIVLYRESQARDQAMSRGARLTLEQLHDQLREGEVKELNIILKTDVGGTAEVLSEMMQKLSNDQVRIRVLHAGVGAINENDVLLASASNAIVVGFNVRPEKNAQAVAEQEKVDIRLHTIIYELTDELKRAMTGMLEPVFREQYKGRAEVRQVFRITKVGNVAGCMVLDGVITRDSEVRLLRDNVVVYTGKIDSLRRFKNDASEVKAGFECGITLRNYADLKPGDVIEAFVTERVAPELTAS